MSTTKDVVDCRLCHIKHCIGTIDRYLELKERIYMCVRYGHSHFRSSRMASDDRIHIDMHHADRYSYTNHHNLYDISHRYSSMQYRCPLPQTVALHAHDSLLRMLRMSPTQEREWWWMIKWDEPYAYHRYRCTCRRTYPSMSPCCEECRCRSRSTIVRRRLRSTMTTTTIDRFSVVCSRRCTRRRRRSRIADDRNA